jgi:hypothetical protein
MWRERRVGNVIKKMAKNGEKKNERKMKEKHNLGIIQVNERTNGITIGWVDIENIIRVMFSSVP